MRLLEQAAVRHVILGLNGMSATGPVLAQAAALQGFPTLPLVAEPAIAAIMLRTRIKRQATDGQRAIARLAAIHTSVTALADEDLLDLADIFKSETATPLAELASAEMAKRNLQL